MGGGGWCASAFDALYSELIEIANCTVFVLDRSIIASGSMCSPASVELHSYCGCCEIGGCQWCLDPVGTGEQVLGEMWM